MQSRFALCASLLLAATIIIIPPAAAQQKDRPIAIFNARVDGHEKPVTILISKGKIRAVAAGLRQAPTGAIGIDAKQSRVVPGRIDVGAALADGGTVLGSALDGFDPYDGWAVQDALLNGVTTVVLVPEESAGFRGQAAVIKLMPGTSVAAIDTDVALCVGMGLANSVVGRAGEVEGIHKSFRKAMAYERAWETYEESLAEYAEALEKEAEAEAKGGGAKKPGPTKPGAKKKEETKKPRQPRVDRTQALLLRVLKGQLPLRILAHTSAALVSALELRDAYPSVRLILEGATEAHLLADLLARSNVPVILGPALRSDLTKASHPLRARADSAALLSRAGVEVFVAGGTWPRSRSVELNAEAYVQAGWDPAEAEAALTNRAAALIGLEDRLGRVAVGYDADLVVLRKGDLGVETPALVIVDGKIVLGGRK